MDRGAVDKLRRQIGPSAENVQWAYRFAGLPFGPQETFLFHFGKSARDDRRHTMGDRGSKDKGKKEQQKKALLTPKEKRKLKKEKKNK